MFGKKISTEEDKKNRREEIWVLILLVVPLLIYSWFGFKHLDQFETADEYRWIYNSESRIPRYWSAMLSHDWKHTRINDKPGISTAIVSGLGLFYAGNLDDRFIQTGEYSNIFNPEASQRINFAFRWPILAFNGLLTILWYFFLRRLLDDSWKALLACSLILLSPILIGISQIVNPDSLLWSTSFTSVVAFLVFLKERKWYDIVIAGIFLGFALLSKYTTIIIVPYWFALIISYLIFQYDNFIRENVFHKRAMQIIAGYVLATALGVAIYVVLMPSVFYHAFRDMIKSNEAFHEIYPYLRIIFKIVGLIFLDAVLLKSWLVKKIFFPFKYLWNIGSRIISGGLVVLFIITILNWAKNNIWNIPNVPYDAGSDKSFKSLDIIYKIFLELKPLVFSLTPVVLVLLIITWFIYAIKNKTKNEFVIFGFSILLIIFYAAVIKENYLVHVRYSLMLYPIVMTIAAIGIFEFVSNTRWKFLFKIAIFVSVMLLSVRSIEKIYPFYFNYTNDLLPKNDIITTSWGYGGYEAAQFISSQMKNPKNLIVWTDYDGFCPFFSGICIKDSEIKWVGFEMTNAISYYVVTKRGSDKFMRTWEKMKVNVNEKPEWELLIDNRPDNYIRVYKVIKSNYKDNDWWRK